MTEIEDRDWVLDDHDWSDKAWMSETDADLFEAILRRNAESVGPAASSDAPGPLEILEWGSGRSTLYYTGVLRELGVPFRWLSLEYNRDYFERELEPALGRLPDRRVVRFDEAVPAEGQDIGAEPRSAQSVDLVVFDKGELLPMLRAHPEDRAADLDAYVDYPGRQGRRYDVVLVDGRKRRRCLVAASRMLAGQGVALLHDAWRPYYDCAFGAFRSDRRIGDILRIASQLPEEALDDMVGELERFRVR